MIPSQDNTLELLLGQLICKNKLILLEQAYDFLFCNNLEVSNLHFLQVRNSETNYNYHYPICESRQPKGTLYRGKSIYIPTQICPTTRYPRRIIQK